MPSNLDKSIACSTFTIRPVNLSLSTTIPEMSFDEKSSAFRESLIKEESDKLEFFILKWDNLQLSKLADFIDEVVIEKSFKMELLKLQ